MPRETQSERVRRMTNGRVQPRVKVHSLAYVELGDGNAGLILNISETGIAVQAVQMLVSNHLPKMQFRLPKTETLIEVSGDVVWQIRSKKEAGIKFTGLADSSRAAIRTWIAAEHARLASAAAEEQRKAEQNSEAQAGGTPRTPRQSPGPILHRASSTPARPETPASARQEAEADTDYREEEVERTAQESQARAVEPPAVRVERPGRTQAERADATRTAPDLTPPQRRMPTHWRVGPAGSPRAEESRYGERLPFERAPAMPQWNGRMAPGVGMDLRKSRRWWTYTATLGLLAAVGFAGLMAIDPSLISRARIDALTHEFSRNPNDDQAAGQDGSPAAQPGGPAETQNPEVPGGSSQPSASTPPNGQAQSPSPQGGAQAGEHTPATSEPARPEDRAGQAGTVAHPNNRQRENGSGADERRERSVRGPQSQVPDNRGAASARRGYNAAAPAESSGRQTAQQTPQRQNGTSNGSRSGEGRSNEAAATQGAGSPSTAGQPMYSSTSAQPSHNENSGVSPPRANEDARQPTQKDAGRQSPIETWRAQTAQTSVPEQASRSNANGGKQLLARTEQDAYARSAPYSPARPANRASNGASGAGIAVVNVPSYQSSPVPPSSPLAGVPSGSVAATSQFRAVRIPANLAWTRSQLPSNLQMGHLVSSYSPAYPIEAAREGIEGVVKLEVSVGSDGTVRSVHVVSGPAMLSSAAVSAVRDWRYSETFLAGQAVESEHYVSMVFRLATAH
jgi:TonB family protein